MKEMTLEETLEHIKNHPTSHDIQVVWEDLGGPKAGRLRRLTFNKKEETVTFKTNSEEVTKPINMVSFNRSGY